MSTPGRTRAIRRPRVDIARLLRTPANRIAARVVPELPSVVRLVVASVLSFVVVNLLTPGTTDITAPLTALLIVQANLYQTVRAGAARMVAVLLGVGVAIVISTWVGLHWWSLGAVILLGLLLAITMGIKDNKLEVPISAMLILGVTQHDTAAETRLVYTLVGGAVGIAVTILAPPLLRLRTAEAMVNDLAEDAATTLREDAAEAVEHFDRPTIERWTGDIHALLPQVAEAEAALTAAHESRRLNPRAVATVNYVPVLRAGLGALDRTLLAIRQIFMTLSAQVPDDGDGVANVGTDEDHAGFRGLLSMMLLDVADAVEAFADLVVADAVGEATEASDRLRETLAVLTESRDQLVELAQADPDVPPVTWLMRGSLVAALERVLHELDADAYVTERTRLVTEALDRRRRRTSLPNAWGIRVLDLAEILGEDPDDR